MYPKALHNAIPGVMTDQLSLFPCNPARASLVSPHIITIGDGAHAVRGACFVAKPGLAQPSKMTPSRGQGSRTHMLIDCWWLEPLSSVQSLQAQSGRRAQLQGIAAGPAMSLSGTRLAVIEQEHVGGDLWQPVWRYGQEVLHLVPAPASHTSAQQHDMQVQASAELRVNCMLTSGLCSGMTSSPARASS